MAPIENEAIEFVRAVLRLYFEQRDINGLLAVLDVNAAWIGADGQEISGGFAELERALAREMMTRENCLIVADDALAVSLLSKSLCVVSGELCVQNEDASAYPHRVSALCAKAGSKIKLRHLHLSQPNGNGVCGSFCARKIAQEDNRALRDKVEKISWELQERNRELATLTDNIPGGIHKCLNDAGFTLLEMSRGFFALCGYTREEIRVLFGDRFINMVYPGDRATLRCSAQKQSDYGEAAEFEYRLMCKDGSVRWILDKANLVTMADGTQFFYCMLVDITSRKLAQEELRLSLERHQVIMNQATDIIFEWDIFHDSLHVSPNWQKKFGYEAICTEVSTRIPQSPNIPQEDMPQFINLMQSTAAGTPYSETEFRIRNVAGTYIWCRIRATTQFDTDGYPIKAVGVIVDIDEEKKQTQKLLDQAQKDGLTGLYNKATTQVRVEEALRDSAVRTHALFIIDLDNFKQVNDQYGHLCGDAVLTTTADCLRKLFRASDIMGRIGGDEFLVFLPDISDRETITEKAKRILLSLGEVSIEEAQGMALSCSIGIALFPGDAMDYESLYRCADRALYRVKNSGKENLAFFDAQMDDGRAPRDAEYSAVSGTIDSELSTLSQTLARYTFQMLYDSVDIKLAISRILEIVGRSCNVSRAYIFENSEDGQFCSNTFEWCNKGITSQINHLQNLAYTDFGDFRARIDTNEILYCHDINTLHPSVSQMLAQQGIVSLLQCPISDDGTFRGFVGFDECRMNRVWTKEQIDSLTLVAKVLSTFLMKLRLKEQLTEKNMLQTTI